MSILWRRFDTKSVIGDEYEQFTKKSKHGGWKIELNTIAQNYLEIERAKTRKVNTSNFSNKNRETGLSPSGRLSIDVDWQRKLQYNIWHDYRVYIIAILIIIIVA